MVLKAKFKEAKEKEPCIIFLEEFECIARIKGTTLNFNFKF